MKSRFGVSFAMVCGAGMALALVGCGGGSSAPASTSVSGVASKGPLNGAQVCAFAVTDGAKGAAIGTCATTDANGNYTIDLGTHTGPVLFEATGGSYTDEATGAPTTLVTPLHNVVANPGSGAITVAVTPLTELAYQIANAGSGGLTTTNIQNAVGSVQTNFGVDDITATQPVDALNVPGNATAAQKAYALALATVSQYLNAQPSGTTLAQALQTLRTCLSAPSSGCGSAPNTVGTDLDTAMGNFQAGHSSFSGVTLPIANFGSVSGGNGGGGGNGGSTGVAGPVVDTTQLATICTGTQNHYGGGTEYTGCNGANLNQSNVAVLNAINAWMSTSSHGAGMTVYNSNYSGVSVGDSCSFAFEPGLGLWLLTVNNTSIALTPGSFDGTASSTIEVNADGEVVRIAVGDFLTAGREISFLSGKIDVVYQSISGQTTTGLFCGNAN